MKNIIKKTLIVTVVLSLLISGITVSANDKSVRYSFKNGTLTISGTGVADNFDKSVCKPKDITKVVVGEGITELGSNALPHLKKVKNITIAKTVKKMAQSVIYCDKLDKITMPGDFECVVPPMGEDQDAEDYNDMPSALAIIPGSIHLNTPINKMNQTKYMTFTTKKIYTAKNDKKFKSYKGVIYSKNGKKLVYVPSETKVLNVRKGCTTISMRSMTYSYDVQGDDYAFCNKLKKVSLPKSVRKVVNDTFEPGYDGAKKAKWNIKSKKMTGTAIKNLKLMLKKKYVNNLLKQTKGIKKVRGMWVSKDHVLIRYDGKAKKVTVPKGIKTIANNAFYSKRKMKSIKFPKSLRTIEDWAFNACHKLKTVKWNKGLKSIGMGAFESTNIKTLKLPSSVKSFGEECFAYCAITKITFPKSLTRIPNHMFAGLRVKNLVIPGHVKTIGRYAFSGCEGDTLEFKEGVEMIDSGAFDESQTFKKVTFTKSIKEIAQNAFAEMTVNLLVLNGMNATVGEGAFFLIKEIDCGKDPLKYTTYGSLISTNVNGECEFRVSKVRGASGLEVEISKSKDFSNPIKMDLQNKTQDYKYNRGSDDFNQYRIRVYTMKNGSKVYGPWTQFGW